MRRFFVSKFKTPFFVLLVYMSAANPSYASGETCFVGEGATATVDFSYDAFRAIPPELEEAAIGLEEMAALLPPAAYASTIVTSNFAGSQIEEVLLARMAKIAPELNILRSTGSDEANIVFLVIREGDDLRDKEILSTLAAYEADPAARQNLINELRNMDTVWKHKSDYTAANNLGRDDEGFDKDLSKGLFVWRLPENEGVSEEFLYVSAFAALAGVAGVFFAALCEGFHGSTLDMRLQRPDDDIAVIRAMRRLGKIERGVE